jgi:hypothetical protein
MRPPIQTPILTKNNFIINDPSWIRWFDSPLTFVPLKRTLVNYSSVVFDFTFNATWTLVGPSGKGLTDFIPSKAKMIWGTIGLTNAGGTDFPTWLDLCPVAPGGVDAQGNSTDGNGRSSFQMYVAGVTYAMSFPFLIPIINQPLTALFYRLADSDPDAGLPSPPGGRVFMYISGYWI